MSTLHRASAIRDFKRWTKELEALEEQAAKLRVRRAGGLRELRASGMRWTEIADAVGLSKQRVDQLLHRGVPSSGGV